MMPGFTSRWLEWESSETPVQRTDKTDRRGKKAAKGASGGSVGSSDGGLGLKTTSGGNVPSPSKTPIQQTDKTDRRLLGSKAKARCGAWDAETARLIEWLQQTPPPAKPFELCRGVVILKPALWWTALKRDIAEGPGGPRAHYGAVQADLRRLARAMRAWAQNQGARGRGTVAELQRAQWEEGG